MKNTILTEKDLESLFSGSRKRQKAQNMFRYLWYILVPILSLVFFFILINLQSFKDNFGYWYQNDYQNNSNNVDQPQLSALKSARITGNETTVQYQKPDLPPLADNNLNIPVLNITAPVVWDIENTPESVSSSLQNGVGHLKGTAHPGQIGNVFITGHSSNYPWIKGNYNHIFALLNKLVVGDLVQINHNKTIYVYKVSNIKTVQPDDISVLTQGQNTILTLMTCTPVGTSLRRLIINANQIYPNPNSNTPSQNNSGNLSMPQKIR